METCDKCGSRYNIVDGRTVEWYAGKYIKTDFLGTQDNVSSYEYTYSDVTSISIHLCPECVSQNIYTESEIDAFNRPEAVRERRAWIGCVISIITLLPIIIIGSSPSIAPESGTSLETIMYGICSASGLFGAWALLALSNINKIKWKPGQPFPNKRSWHSYTRELAEAKAKRIHRDKIFTPEEHAKLKTKW